MPQIARPDRPARRARPGVSRALTPVLTAVALMGVGACGGPGRVVIFEAPVNAQEVALRLESNEALRTPLRVVFQWAISERGGVRADGRGSARLEPPYKARLDLFLGNGEPAGSAAVVDDELRLPATLPPEVLPPPHLLWSSLGVFRPGLGTALLGAERTSDDQVRLRYRLPGGDEAVYFVRMGRIERAEVSRGGTVIQTLTVQRDSLQIPVEALYRDLVEVVELRLTRESTQQTEPFPADIWRPLS